MWGASTGAVRRLREALRGAVFLSPGLADAAFSSLAGFASSLYAVRTLDGPSLGAYSLYLAAYVLGSLFAQHLLFLPSQIAAVRASPRDRSAILRPTLLPGAAISLLVAPIVAAAGLVVSDDVSTSTLVALAAGAIALTVVTPLQDHVRSTLYLTGEHQRAALVSASQLVLTLGALGVLHLSGIPDAWVPLGALAAGTAGSGAFGLALTIFPPAGSFEVPPPRELMRTGMSLLPAALVQEATIFASAAVLASFASAAALGAAEAARIVARPVQAFSLGISRSLAPRLMEAGERRSRSQARRGGGLYVIAIGVAGLVYLAGAGWAYPLSPFVEVVPAAYEEEGLVALFIVAAIAGAIAQLPRGVLLGANRGPELLVITVLASGCRVAAVALLAVTLEAYALPVAHLLSLVITGGLGLRATARLLDKA